jgi:hypothetical protein
MVPVLVKFTVLPPVTAMTGVSSLTRVRLASAEEPMLPALVMVVVPPAPLRASSAMPVRLSRLAPSKAPVPLITPVPLLLR